MMHYGNQQSIMNLGVERLKEGCEEYKEIVKILVALEQPQRLFCGCLTYLPHK